MSITHQLLGAVAASAPQLSAITSAAAASAVSISGVSAAAADLSALSRGHWTASAVGVNLFFVINLFGAVLLGMVVGYERAYQGRAAGMRTYALVCMASCSVTIVAGYPEHWFGNSFNHSGPGGIDPTRVIQGVLTGIGFLGAGVITKEGTNISGLTTAASIWACSAIGLLLGMGFYAAAIAMTVISATLMVGMTYLEQRLPMRHAIAVTIRFKAGHSPSPEDLQKQAQELGHTLSDSNLQIRVVDGEQEWQTVVLGSGSVRQSIAQFSNGLSGLAYIREFKLAHTRN